MQLLAPAVVVHGALAIVIILLILIVVVLGVVSLLRITGHGVRKAARTASGHDDGPSS